MTTVDPIESFNYYNLISDRSVFCTFSNIDSLITITEQPYAAEDLEGDNSNLEYVTLSLLTRNHTIGRHSGLNWVNERVATQMKPIFLYPRKSLRVTSFGSRSNNLQLLQTTKEI